VRLRGCDVVGQELFQVVRAAWHSSVSVFECELMCGVHVKCVVSGAGGFCKTRGSSTRESEAFQQIVQL
jgi:hypothetical protein